MQCKYDVSFLPSLHHAKECEEDIYIWYTTCDSLLAKGSSNGSVTTYFSLTIRKSKSSFNLLLGFFSLDYPVLNDLNKVVCLWKQQAVLTLCYTYIAHMCAPLPQMESLVMLIIPYPFGLQGVLDLPIMYVYICMYFYTWEQRNTS